MSKDNWGESCKECGAFSGRINAGNRRAKVYSYTKDGKIFVECSRLFTVVREVLDSDFVEEAQRQLAEYIDMQFDMIVHMTKDIDRVQEVLKRVEAELKKNNLLRKQKKGE